jgi:hypothetical protein
MQCRNPSLHTILIQLQLPLILSAHSPKIRLLSPNRVHHNISVRNFSPHILGRFEKKSIKLLDCRLLIAGFLFGILFHRKDGRDMFPETSVYFC